LDKCAWVTTKIAKLTTKLIIAPYSSNIALFGHVLSIENGDEGKLDKPCMTILADHSVKFADPNAIQADEAGFNAWIAFFIEANATDDDPHELLDFIRHAKKPCY
jgi:hypothetical protein